MFYTKGRHYAKFKLRTKVQVMVHHLWLWQQQKKKMASKKTYLLWKPNIDHNWQRENCMDKQNCWINKPKLHRKLTPILYSGYKDKNESYIVYFWTRQTPVCLAVYDLYSQSSLIFPILPLNNQPNNQAEGSFKIVDVMEQLTILRIVGK